MFFDAHTHIHFAAFENDWQEVASRALEKKVWFITVGTQRDTSARAVEAAREYEEGVYAAVGLHPIHTEKSYHDVKELGEGLSTRAFTSRGEEFDFDYYQKLAVDPKVVAIGECGLDYYRLNYETKEKQTQALVRQIELAHEVKKPLMIHCREAFDDLIGVLEAHHGLLSGEPGVIHFFTGTKDEARRLAGLGFGFTFGGVITFARNYDEVVKFLPLDRILSETDAPYVTPVPYRGERNEPAYVVEIVKRLAELRNLSLEEMAEKIFENAKRIFKIAS